MTTTQYALTHVKEYIFEIVQYERDIECYFSDDFKKVVDKEVAKMKSEDNFYADLAYADIVTDTIRECKTIKQILSVLEQCFKEHYFGKIDWRIEGFFKAMKAVVPHLEYKDHGGTEDRGWWRVYGEIIGFDPYFCSFDLGRDMMMAKKFYDSGAITQEQYNNHVTKRTLAMMRSVYFQTDGQPDAEKVLNYVKDEYRTSEFFDMRFIDAIAA